jgi:hypothetical protein
VRPRRAAAPSLRRRARRLPAPAFAVVLVAVALSGCLNSGYTYFSHTNPDKTDLYFKIPSSWTTYTNSQLIQSVNGKLSNAQISQIAGAQWLVAFTGRHHATAKDAGIIGNYYPGGYTFAQQLSTNNRDSLSLSAMRAEILGVDPLTAGSSAYNVLSYNEFTRPGGIRGSKMVVNIGTPGSVILTYGQVVEVDPQTNWIFAVGVGCRASCWGPNQGVINQVLSTWQVKEEG